MLRALLPPLFLLLWVSLLGLFAVDHWRVHFKRPLQVLNLSLRALKKKIFLFNLSMSLEAPQKSNGMLLEDACPNKKRSINPTPSLTASAAPKDVLYQPASRALG